MTLTQGQILNNRYRVVKLLGQGGFGAVYKAWDTTLNRPCALKEAFETSPEGQRQFLREAQILANLTHPNLPRVTDFFALPGQGQYLVMDFVEGQDLEDARLKAGGALPPAQVLDWILQVLDAVSYLHRQKQPVIHRDIKPANIKITPPDEEYPSGKAILVDFGIAKTFDLQKDTTVGARAVTRGYSPIEQYGKGVTDTRTDVYALGATLYALLTGKEPPDAPMRVVGDRLVAPRQLNPNIPPVVETALLKALQISPERRFQQVGEFRRALGGTSPAAGPGNVPLMAPAPARRGAGYGAEIPVGYPPPPKRRSAWRWVVIGLGLLGCLAAIAVLAVYIISDGNDTHVTETAVAARVTGIARADINTREAAAQRTEMARATTAWETYSVQTAVAQETQTAQAMVARQTGVVQTAVALETQNIASIAQTVAGYQVSSNLLAGPVSGELVHHNDEYIETASIYDDIMNFVIEVVFQNPYAASTHDWDYGIIFRDTGTNNQYRLIIRFNGEWVLKNSLGDPDSQIVASGYIEDLNVNDGEENSITLAAINDVGYLFVNDVFISELILSGRLFAGDLFIATGIYIENEVDGESTLYHDLYLWGVGE